MNIHKRLNKIKPVVFIFNADENHDGFHAVPDKETQKSFDTVSEAILYSTYLINQGVLEAESSFDADCWCVVIQFSRETSRFDVWSSFVMNGFYKDDYGEDGEQYSFDYMKSVYGYAGEPIKVK